MCLNLSSSLLLCTPPLLGVLCEKAKEAAVYAVNALYSLKGFCRENAAQVDHHNSYCYNANLGLFSESTDMALSQLAGLAAFPVKLALPEDWDGAGEHATGKTVKFA